MVKFSFPGINNNNSSHFKFNILLICFAYLSYELLFIPHTLMALDEFWFGHHIYEYTKYLPYRDFPPYKTVLGYYLLSIPMYFSHSLLDPLYYIKDEIAILNTVLLLWIAFYSKKMFNHAAILITLLILISSQLFLIYSVELRVDMLTAWLGLLSVLFVLGNRPFWGGIALAVSFLVSQKALWFFLSEELAFLCYWLYAERNIKTLLNFLKFNLGLFFPIVSYLTIWSFISNSELVLRSVFYEAYTQSKILWYSAIYFPCWQSILSSGPLLFLLWPLTWLGNFTNDDSLVKKRRIFITAFSTTMLIFIISYQQAFPYNAVYSVPVYFILYADFFSWFILFIKNKTEIICSRRILFWLISLSSISTVGIILAFGLPLIYLMITLIPMSLGYFCIHPKNKNMLFIALILFFSGILYPLLTFITSNTNAEYQQNMLQLANSLLQNDDKYIAGSPFFYNKDQPIAGLKNLIGPQIEYLSNQDPKLLPILISSLYLTPRTSFQVINDLKSTSIKLIINNDRIISLPSNIRHYLESEFQQYWGSIFLYAPKISAGSQVFYLKFSGNYLVKTGTAANGDLENCLIKITNLSLKTTNDLKTKIIIDNQPLKPLATIYLTKGKHISNADGSFRLNLVPDTSKLILNKEFSEDHFNHMYKHI